MKKRVYALLVILGGLQPVFAANTANIKINISGPNSGYYLCMPDLGCLSLKAAKRGKIFPSLSNIQMNTLFITNLHNRRIYNQGLPSSCHVTVKTNQTITISGTLNAQGDKVKINNLHCAVS